MELADLFPKHACSLYLTHDPHKNCYQTVEKYEDDIFAAEPEWVSPEQRARAIASNSFWELQWYPDTPIGFYRLLACDLDVLLAAARKAETK